MENAIEHTNDGSLRRTHTIRMDKVNPKNVMGNLGPRCDWCSGLGFTNAITGGSHSCDRCDGSGIKIDKLAMQKQIDELQATVINLKKEIEKQ